VFPADIRKDFHCYTLQVGSGSPGQTVIELPTCSETVAITVAMERLFGVFRAAWVKLPGRQTEMLKVKASRLGMSLTQNEQRHVEQLLIDAWRASHRWARAPQALRTTKWSSKDHDRIGYTWKFFLVSQKTLLNNLQLFTVVFLLLKA